MRSSHVATNPWGETIDDGWKDLVVSSAPPPPPREALEPVARNRPLPADFKTWQEHGAPRAGATVAPPIEEPNFTAADRRLWLVAGTLMGLATLVLAVLGMLTFGGSTSSAPAPALAADAPRATVEPAHAAASPSRAAVVAAKSSNPRLLKTPAHSNRARHHKRVAAR